MAKVRNLKIKEKAFGIIGDGSLFMSGYSLCRGINNNNIYNYIFSAGLLLIGGVSAYKEKKKYKEIKKEYNINLTNKNNKTIINSFNSSYNSLRICSKFIILAGGYILCRDGLNRNTISLAAMYGGMLFTNELIKNKTKKLIKEGK